MQSIFTSMFFTEFVNSILPVLDAQAVYVTPDGRGGFHQMSPGSVKTRFDGDDLDHVNFLNKFGGFLEDATCNLDTGIGYSEQGEPFVANIDPINAEVGTGVYRVHQHAATARYYFPTPALVDALNHTELKWIDLSAFADLPPVIGVRLRGFKMKVNGEVHNCDDFLLVRDTTPSTRRKALMDHATPPAFHETALVFHWLTQSRDELHLGLQSQTFGTFVLHQDMKLDDILAAIDEWSRREVARVQHEAKERGLLDVVADSKHHHNPDLAPEFSRMATEHADYLTNTLSQVSWDDEQRIWYADILRFIFKVVLLLSAEGVKIKALTPPGIKEKENPSRKAKKIHEQLWKAWGRRYLLDVPPESPEQVEERKSPTRHRVVGHFKSQPYGPGSSLRKIIWRQPFWRGTTTLA